MGFSPFQEIIKAGNAVLDNRFVIFNAGNLEIVRRFKFKPDDGLPHFFAHCGLNFLCLFFKIAVVFCTPFNLDNINLPQCSVIVIKPYMPLKTALFGIGKIYKFNAPGLRIWAICAMTAKLCLMSSSGV